MEHGEKTGSDKNADMLNIETLFLHTLKFEQRSNMVEKQATNNHPPFPLLAFRIMAFSI